MIEEEEAEEELGVEANIIEAITRVDFMLRATIEEASEMLLLTIQELEIMNHSSSKATREAEEVVDLQHEVEEEDFTSSKTRWHRLQQTMRRISCSRRLRLGHNIIHHRQHKQRHSLKWLRQGFIRKYIRLSNLGLNIHMFLR